MSTAVVRKDSADYFAKWVSSTGGAYDLTKSFLLASQYAKYLPLNEMQKAFVNHLSKATTLASSALFTPLFISEANDFRHEQDGPAAASLVNTGIEVVYFLKLAKLISISAKMSPIVDIIYNGSSLLTDAPNAYREYQKVQELRGRVCRSSFEKKEVELQIDGAESKFRKCSSSVVMATMGFASLYFAMLAATAAFTIAGLVLSSVYLQGSASKAFTDLALDEHRKASPAVPLYLRI